ncbi:hypothetical protein PCY08_04315 [Streptococcus sp. SO4]|uniref:hypothetical protein n=1 Tax=Streptococcus sp. SO4 TaxID=3018249 RepID=UPI00263E129A|nr:hypothetical protein [Streptococcus sp. SO4]MDN5024663.1 hypothetical protein [Streptococcus sp. SO4]
MSEIAKFLIKNNLINETYTDYLVRQSPNGLSGDEKNFLVSVLLKDSEELKKIKVLKQDKIYEIFLKLSDHHFSVDNFFNEAIYDYFNKSIYDNNENIIKGIENYFKKIIFLHDVNDPQKITLNINSISRILYNKLVNPQEDHLFTKMKSYISDNQISDSINDDVKLLLLILDKKINLDFAFNLDVRVNTLLERIQNISKEADKQTLEKKLLDLILDKINNIDKINRIFHQNNFKKLSLNRKEFYKILWKKEKIKFTSVTFLSILSILEDKQLDSYKDIYDKLNTEDAKNLLIENLYMTKSIFESYNNESRDNSYISYLTSNSSSFKSIISAYKKQDDQEIPFNIFNPNILWEELTNVQSEISRNHYKEIFNTLDKDFITEQLNKSSISLISFKKLLENYKDSFSSKINIETLKNDKMKSLIQIPKKKTLKRNSDKRKYKKNSLIKYINQHSKFDNIDKDVINRYSVDDLLSTKDSINNKELYLDILNMKKRTVRNTSNINKIEKVITELKSELLDTSGV